MIRGRADREPEDLKVVGEVGGQLRRLRGPHPVRRWPQATVLIKDPVTTSSLEKKRTKPSALAAEPRARSGTKLEALSLPMGPATTVSNVWCQVIPW